MFGSFQRATYPRPSFTACFAGAQPATVLCLLAPSVCEGAVAAKQCGSQATDEVRSWFLLLL